ncbi:RsfA family transcriptional regulator [Bacillus sp. FJAT-49711]|uniref:RsfA family transcriptional regulator n=1 Tax=Bacillus sp. FJAT-49711 TaxID=2833585 RepID=UPI001BC9630F|nr:RsfA family transcriptional regulator [Bacillus sp. FJAT-49711]MBS4217856.1 RsfA family transcriptional regulator [Bacillus sp. FJAT-49711]
MTAARQDAWTSDEDLVLAELVLAYIREGSTQLQAFEEAGKKLKRTAAACGFRWNSNIRKKYKEGIELAKKQRNENKKEKSVEAQEVVQEDSKGKNISMNDSVILSDAILFFQKLENELAAIEKYKHENDRLINESMLHKIEKEEAVKALEELTKEFNQLKGEYRSLITLIDKARKMAGELSDGEKIKVPF